MKKKALLLLIVALALIALPVPAKQRDATVTVQSVKVYQKANRKSDVLGSLSKGDTVSVTSVSGSVARIRYQGGAGYVKKSALRLSAEKAAKGVKRAVTVKSKVYKKASRASKVLGTVSPGDTLTVLKKSGGLCRVSLNGQIGYVQASAFSTSSASKGVAPAKSGGSKAGGVSKSKADTVVKAALAQLGKPYVYGSTGMNSFDCSGLTRYAYGLVGISLPHSAYSVGYGAGAKVSRGQLQRGDIVCFDTSSDSDQCDHVGIYMGGGQFVHASSGKGRVVVSALTGYYAQAFSWGRRVL